MTDSELNFMLDTQKQKYLLKILQRLVKEQHMDPFVVLDINKSEAFYVDKLVRGQCKLSPTLANNVLLAAKRAELDLEDI